MDIYVLATRFVLEQPQVRALARAGPNFTFSEGNNMQAAIAWRTSDSGHRTAKIEIRIGLVNGIGVSIHHVFKCPRFLPLAFIFGERGKRMLNRT